jgi:hypothetical protein
MPHTAANPAAMTLLIPLVVLALVVLRNSRARRLRVESLWIMPVMIVALIGLALWQQGAPSSQSLGFDAAALVLGSLIGWWRARFTNISVDPQTHQLTSRASPIGMLVILGVFSIRYGIRFYTAQSAGPDHTLINAIADASLVMSVGLVCAQRLEIALRATRLLNEVRANAPS